MYYQFRHYLVLILFTENVIPLKSRELFLIANVSFSLSQNLKNLAFLLLLHTTDLFDNLKTILNEDKVYQKICIYIHK